MNKEFVYKHRIHFNETNAVGGVAYFSNYVKWQGMVREEWFLQIVPNWREIMHLTSTGQLNMITVEEHSHFIQHAFFGDEIDIHLRMTNVRRFSFDMIFLMFHSTTKRLLYEGMQRLAFDNYHGKFRTIPETMLNAVRDYETDISELRFTKLGKTELFK